MFCKGQLTKYNDDHTVMNIFISHWGEALADLCAITHEELASAKSYTQNPYFTVVKFHYTAHTASYQENLIQICMHLQYPHLLLHHGSQQVLQEFYRK